MNEMTVVTFKEIYQNLTSIGVSAHLDGGWGVDALLGRQTREHSDVDFFIERKDIPKIKSLFESQGYTLVQEKGAWWHFYYVKDATQVDFLVLEFDESGDAFYGPRENNATFPKEVFFAKGNIDGLEVLSFTPEYRVKCLTQEYGIVARNGYKVNEKDCRDMIALCRQFDLDIPSDYTKFMYDNNLTY